LPRRPNGRHDAKMLALPTYAPICSDVDGHQLTVSVSGADRLQAIVSLIQTARETLRLFFYIFADDRVALVVKDALIEASRRGVKVSLLIDGFGSSDLPDSAFAMLGEAGISFGRFNSKWGRRYLVRNHQKLIVADGKRAIVGGSNISESYFSDAPDGSGWHDLCVTLEGPAAARLADYFDSLKAWSEEESRSMRGLVNILSMHSDKDGPIRWMLGGPFQRLSPLTRATKGDIVAAKSLSMIQAYFAPNWGMLRRLSQVVTDRAGTVLLITAARSDNGTTVAAARHCYHRLLARGVTIHEYLPQKLHVKLIIADDIVYLGSANFDMRSLFINAEIMVRVKDAAFAAKMHALAAAHLPHSDEITREEHRIRATFFSRARWLFSYFIVSTVDFTVTRRFNLRRTLQARSNSRRS
jgi:cardiolipin synthase A/B